MHFCSRFLARIESTNIIVGGILSTNTGGQFVLVVLLTIPNETQKLEPKDNPFPMIFNAN